MVCNFLYFYVNFLYFSIFLCKCSVIFSILYQRRPVLNSSLISKACVPHVVTSCNLSWQLKRGETTEIFPLRPKTILHVLPSWIEHNFFWIQGVIRGDITVENFFNGQKCIFLMFKMQSPCAASYSIWLIYMYLPLVSLQVLGDFSSKCSCILRRES